jgi:hypothetical protein
MRRNRAGKLSWLAQDHRRRHAKGVVDEALESGGELSRAGRGFEEDVAARDVGPDASVARVLEQRPQLRHRHLCCGRRD